MLKNSSHANFDIREMAQLLRDALPESHKYLFEEKQ